MRLSARERREKAIDADLCVHAWTPAGFLRAGVLKLDEAGEAISATFRYDQTYLDHPHAYPLDPLNMPLGATLHATASPFVRLGSIFDAAPDAWGRRVVQAQLPAHARERVFRGAFLRGADGIGSLVLTPLILEAEDIALEDIVQLSLTERPSLSQLAGAADAAWQFEQGDALTPAMREMLGGSWTIGGARPKAILRQDAPGALPAESVIAKFPSVLDRLDRSRLEFATLEMAADMGFNVGGRELRECLLHNASHDGARPVAALVLERFDRLVRPDGVRRRHYLSAMSLASYQPQSKLLNTRQDQAVLSWARLLDLSSRVAAKPAHARVEMFARLCLNAALQNTDDHLKNFGFLKGEDSPVHYELAPVFDVSPQASERHYLHCADLGQTYGLKEALSRARVLGISRGACEEVEERIVSVLLRRRDYLERAAMSGADVELASQWIGQGMAGYEEIRRESERQR